MFQGALAVDIFLSGISDFLQAAYSQSSQNAFVLERETLHIIGTSLPEVALYTEDSTTGSKVMTGKYAYIRVYVYIEYFSLFTVLVNN